MPWCCARSARVPANRQVRTRNSLIRSTSNCSIHVQSRCDFPRGAENRAGIRRHAGYIVMGLEDSNASAFVDELDEPLVTDRADKVVVHGFTARRASSASTKSWTPRRGPTPRFTPSACSDETRLGSRVPHRPLLTRSRCTILTCDGRGHRLDGCGSPWPLRCRWDWPS